MFFPPPPQNLTHLNAAFFVSVIYFIYLPGYTYIVQFKVKAAGVTHRVSVPVAPPQGGGGGLAVCAAGACASCSRLTETQRKNTA